MCELLTGDRVKQERADPLTASLRIEVEDEDFTHTRLDHPVPSGTNHRTVLSRDDPPSQSSGAAISRAIRSTV